MGRRWARSRYCDNDILYCNTEGNEEGGAWQGDCEDRIGTGPPRARTEVINVDLGYSGLVGNKLMIIQRDEAAPGTMPANVPLHLSAAGLWDLTRSPEV